MLCIGLSLVEVVLLWTIGCLNYSDCSMQTFLHSQINHVASLKFDSG